MRRHVPFFGAFGAAWDDAMVARWSANPLSMLWPKIDGVRDVGWRKRRPADSSVPSDGGHCRELALEWGVGGAL